MLKINSDAPDFNLPNQSNEVTSLANFKGIKNVVLYFYPKDDTPGCTVEAQQFSALIGEFDEHETVIIGVSKDDVESHLCFIDKYRLQVMLVSDVDGEICEKYQVWQEKEKNGIKKMGIVRSTFIIDKAGSLVDLEYGVTADGHADLVLQKIKKL